MMKIDNNKLDEFRKMNDKELWLNIRKIASQNGISLPDKDPSENEIRQLRELLFNTDKINPFAAMRMINKFKRGDNNG
jgi:hypothetical protein